MKLSLCILAGLAVLALSGTMAGAAEDTVFTAVTTAAPETGGTPGIETIPPYDGPIGADSPLYGLKVAWEDLDESFTTNETELTEKQLNHARLRISEVRRELAQNRSATAEQALALYWQKMNQTQLRIAYYAANSTGLVHAQEMHLQHQQTLQELMQANPENPGLARAYNNSLQLGEKFQEKTQVRFEKMIGKDNRTILKAYRLEEQQESRTGAGTGAAAEVREQERTEGRSMGNVTGPAVTKTMQVKPDTGNKGNQDSQEQQNNAAPPVTVAATPGTPAPAVTTATQGQGPAGSPGNGNGDETGKGNPHGK